MGDWDFEDRRAWRYSTGGRPIELTWQMLRLLTAEDPTPADLGNTPLSGLVTEASRSIWQSRIDSAEERKTWRQRHLGLLPLVRHPAPDIAYVFALPGHPDQTDNVVIERTTQASAFIFTLVYETELHDWKIHSLGPPTPPAALRKTPFQP